MMQSAALSRLVVLGSATLGGLALAFLSGRAIAQGNYNLIAMITAGFLGMTIFLATGRNAYIMLAMAVGMTGSIGALPLPFSYQELMIFGAFGVTLGQLTFKKLRLEGRSISLDIFVLINIIYMITVYIRNPAGVRAFGSEIVGGRPYLVVLVSVLFYFAIAQYKLPPKLAPKFPLIIAGPVIALSLVAMTAFFVPGFGKMVYPFWSGVGLDRGIIEAAGGTSAGGDSAVSRIPGSSLIGITSMQLLCAYLPVGHFITPMNPLPFAAFVLAILGWLASGFRSGFLVYGGYLFYNSVLRRRLHDLVPLVTFAVLAIGIVILGQGSLFQLPLGMQRSLSFLPGDWDNEAKSDADASTEWRLNIWQHVWNNEEFIKDKVFGDGFGFSAYDLKLQIDSILGIGGYMDDTSAEMVTGAYHSGPLSSIRYVGMVGLVLFAALQIATLVYATKLVRRAWGTPYQPIALFLAVPMLYGTISFYLIYGGYENELPRTIFAVGFLKFVEFSLRDYLAKPKVEIPNVVPTAVHQRLGTFASLHSPRS